MKSGGILTFALLSGEEKETICELHSRKWTASLTTRNRVAHCDSPMPFPRDFPHRRIDGLECIFYRLFRLNWVRFVKRDNCRHPRPKQPLWVRLSMPREPPKSMPREPPKCTILHNSAQRRPCYTCQKLTSLPGPRRTSAARTTALGSFLQAAFTAETCTILHRFCTMPPVVHPLRTLHGLAQPHPYNKGIPR